MALLFNPSSFVQLFFIQVSAPVWNRDYFYLNGKLQDVRDYMKENCVHTVAEELLSLALDIFSRWVMTIGMEISFV